MRAPWGAASVDARCVDPSRHGTEAKMGDDENDTVRVEADTVERWRCPKCGEWLPVEMEGAACNDGLHHVILRRAKSEPDEPLPEIPRDRLIARVHFALRVAAIALLLLAAFVSVMLLATLLGAVLP
jgi:hypothetical protein